MYLKHQHDELEILLVLDFPEKNERQLQRNGIVRYGS